ncbi:MAG: hypothetical protein IT299_03240, partial [Dehalococcoidia bacterium]|nr:hypothetical protein [Dehalococcoidia bacterium]
MTYDTSARTVRPASHHRGAPPASAGSTEQASRDGRPLVLVYGAHRDFRARAALAFLDALGARAVHACGPRGESLGPAHPARLVMAELAL